MDTEQRVMEMIGKACGVEPARIRSNAVLQEYGLDSVRAVELLVSLEESFSISIPDELIYRIKTVADAVQCVRQKVASAAREQRDEG